MHLANVDLIRKKDLGAVMSSLFYLITKLNLFYCISADLKDWMCVSVSMRQTNHLHDQSLLNRSCLFLCETVGFIESNDIYEQISLIAFLVHITFRL